MAVQRLCQSVGTNENNMKFYIGVTDNNWYNFLKSRDNEDINFWQPGGNSQFRVLNPGEPFLFKLKAPINKIAGIGFFTSFSFLPLEMAWNIFGERNGVSSLNLFRTKILSYRNENNSFMVNPNIGCIILTDPIFFDENDWLDAPINWKPGIIQGKSYNNQDEIGLNIWTKIEELLAKYHLTNRADSNKSQLLLEEPEPQYASKYLTKVRLGQGAFRLQLTEAYNRKCSLSGERTLPVLEAAHIKPFGESGPNYISNGILLRADLHKLYDSGYITFNKDYVVEVSSRIKLEFENGKDYYKYHGQNLMVLPTRHQDKPENTYIEWHNNNIYNG